METTTNLFTLKAVPQNDNDIDDIYLLLEELYKKNRKNFNSKIKSIDGTIHRAEEINESLDQAFPFFDSSIVATDIAYALAVLYDSTYNICVIIDKDKKGSGTLNLPERIEYKDIKDLRNKIGVRYTSPSVFIKEDVLNLLEFVKTVINDFDNNISQDDCININNIMNLIAGNITKLLLSSQEKTSMAGKDYVLEITENEKAPEPVAEPEPETAPARGADNSADASAQNKKENKFNYEHIESENIIEPYEMESQSDEEFVATGTAAELLSDILGDIEKLKTAAATRDSIKATLNINVPNTGLSNESKSIVDDILKNINSTIDTHLKPLNDKVEEGRSAIEAKFAALYGELDKLKASVKEI